MNAGELLNLILVGAIGVGGVVAAYVLLGLVGAVTTIVTLGIMLWFLRGQLAEGESTSRQSKGARGGE